MLIIDLLVKGLKFKISLNKGSEIKDSEDENLCHGLGRGNLVNYSTTLA